MPWTIVICLACATLFNFAYKFLKWFTSPLRGATVGRTTYANSYTFDKSNGSGKQSFPSLFDEPSLYMSLVAPAYNEEARITPFLDETLAYLRKREAADPAFTWEIIIVNDGSKDRTAEIARSYCEKVGTDRLRLLDYGANGGKGFAVQQGVTHARGELVLMVDSDGASEITHVERLEKAVAAHKGGAAIAVGSRAHYQDEAEVKRTCLRNLLMHGFHFLVACLAVRGIRDTQCGFKLFTRAAARKVFPSQHLMRWAFDVELLYLALQFGIPVSEVPIKWQDVEGSKLDPASAALEMGRDLVLIRACYLLGHWRPVPDEVVAAAVKGVT